MDIKQCTLKTELGSNSNKDYIQIKKYLEKIKTMISEINLAIRKSKPMGIQTQQNFLTRQSRGTISWPNTGTSLGSHCQDVICDV